MILIFKNCDNSRLSVKNDILLKAKDKLPILWLIPFTVIENWVTNSREKMLEVLV